MSETVQVDRFDYGSPQPIGAATVVTPPTRPRTAQLVPSHPTARVALDFTSAASSDPSQGDPARADATAAQQAAFAQGYAQGERAGLDLAARQLQAMHERLGHTLERLSGLREELTYRTERDVVELALGIAARILHREVSADRELLLVMARLALDRLGDVTAATIRLHPDDEAAARGGRDEWSGRGIAVVADPTVQAGGCVVQTDRGQVEVGVDAQIKELSTALLGDQLAASQSAA